MTIGTFARASALTGGGLGLALAPALTPAGLVEAPSFFHGFAVHPQVLARGLLTLADVTATRYFNYVPAGMRDPVLTAHGDRLRAECFSACNGVYARLDLLGAGFDGGAIARGTTNVDIGPPMRSALTRIRRAELLHLDIGDEGVTVSTPDRTARERPVQMPDRWVRALGNVAALHHGLEPAFTLDAAGTRQFVAGLPSATAAGRDGWLTPSPSGVRISARPRAGAVHVAGLHRLSAIRRMLSHLEGMTVYGPPGRPEGSAVVAFQLPAARLTLGLTPEPWRGFSGEGSLLPALAASSALQDADLVAASLAFEPILDVPQLARRAGLRKAAVRDALAVLAVSGRVGWDLHENAWFHRELPHDPARVDKDNPRLVAARRLVEQGAVRSDAEGGAWRVRAGSPGAPDHLVRRCEGADSCTCPWYLAHGGDRGPCKHVLAARIFAKEHA